MMAESEDLVPSASVEMPRCSRPFLRRPSEAKPARSPAGSYSCWFPERWCLGTAQSIRVPADPATILGDRVDEVSNCIAVNTISRRECPQVGTIARRARCIENIDPYLRQMPRQTPRSFPWAFRRYCWRATCGGRRSSRLVVGCTEELTASGLGVAAPSLQAVDAQPMKTATAASAQRARVFDTDEPLRTTHPAPAARPKQPTWLRRAAIPRFTTLWTTWTSGVVASARLGRPQLDAAATANGRSNRWESGCRGPQ